jgi:serine/threonine protein kinase/tetratricopeptide (TPR) repeat protein
LPAPGSSFLGFRLLAVLGRGTFGQVYLAEQGDLANRHVTLKVARDGFGEPQTLAQLQHTNIVPIYSTHAAGLFQAVCMPYFGATTLEDVLAQMAGKAERPGSGQVLVKTIEERKQAVSSSLQGAVLPARPLPLVPLERMTYVETVLWIGERLADGLAHAHERGILHHDLKPANVLLTDDGQPMLLDFNLSEDTKRRSGASLFGGTLPYMAPEHLAAAWGPARKLDARSDLYSLGVILYELLAGHRPFGPRAASSGESVASLVAERQRPPRSLRLASPGVSPAVASIVGRCLEPDPARRYQSARELQEDLRRQRENLPLRYAPEPSTRECVCKWARRHQRLTSTTSLALVLGAVLAVLATAYVLRGERLGRLEAQEGLRELRAEAASAEILLSGRNVDRSQLEEGTSRCRRALGRFAVLERPDWQRSIAVRRLSRPDQEALRQEVGEILLLLAQATALEAQTWAAPAERDDKLREAEELNHRAEACFGEEVPRALWEQRADLARFRGNARAAGELAARAGRAPLRTPRDYYLFAQQQVVRGNLRQALELLRKATQEAPGNFPAWFVRGNCYYELLENGNAIACFKVCIALRPELPWAWYNRGLAYLRARRYREAVDDFDRALLLKPDLSDAYVGRAQAREGMKALGEAIADYTEALAQPGASTRIYFLRSAVRARAGDHAGAGRDYAAGLAAEPTDELGWIARGSARRDHDPKGALADYEQALRLNPRSFDGLQNKAALLCDKFGKDAEALAVLERAVELYPESVLARGGRGVLLARAGKRPAALEDARACLLLDSGPATLYQVACIYALTSKQSPDDRLRALPLLAAALRAGFGLEFVGHDPDLNPLRGLPEFQRLVAAARVLR